MHLSELKLWNFRIFGSNGSFDIEKPNLIVNFQEGINVLIGENDSGKTAIIDAIKLVLKTHSKEWISADDEDFFNDSERLRIECCFKNLSEEESSHFLEWLDWVVIDGKGCPCLTVFYDVTRSYDRIFPADIKAGHYDTGHLLTAEAKEFLRTTYLRPLRDAKSELSPKRNSRLSQILLSHDAFADKKGHRLIGLAKTLNKEITEYFKGKDADGKTLDAGDLLGKQVKEVIDQYLKQFANKSIAFEMTPANLKSILESLCLLFEDGYNLGLGSHNLLCIASELLHLKKENWAGLRLGLIEEIEAHLHPQVQLQVVETLTTHAQGMQLIITTHSPNIGSKIPLENLIICNRGKTFPLRRGATKLDHSDYRFLEIFLDTTKANLFFSKGIILVEGWAEEILVPVIAKAIGINLTECGVSVINVGSTAYMRFAKIFQRTVSPQMDIPVAIVTDVDIRPYERFIVKDSNLSNTQNADTLQSMKGPAVEKTAIEPKSEINPNDEATSPPVNSQPDSNTDKSDENQVVEKNYDSLKDVSTTASSKNSSSEAEAQPEFTANEGTQNATTEDEEENEDTDDDEVETKYDYRQRDAHIISNEVTQKQAKIDKSEGQVKYYIGKEWTLEYCMYKSKTFQDLFVNTTKKIHSKTDWSVFEKKLAQKLIEKTLNKTEIAYHMSGTILELLDQDPLRERSPLKNISGIDKNSDALGYIVKAIHHACNL